MTKESLLFSVYGRYSTTLDVWAEEACCYECKKTKKCLLIDTSREEYSSAIFCIDCLINFSKGMKSQRNLLDKLEGDGQ